MLCALSGTLWPRSLSTPQFQVTQQVSRYQVEPRPRALVQPRNVHTTWFPVSWAGHCMFLDCVLCS